jgi:hypothetical protein
MPPSVPKPGADVPTYRQLTSQPVSPSRPALMPSTDPSQVDKPDATKDAIPLPTRSALFPLVLTLAIVFAFAALFWWDRLN